MAILLFLAVVRVWNYKGPARLQPIVNPVAALLLCTLFGLDVTISKTAFRYAVTGAAVIAAAYVIASRFSAAERSDAHPWRKALVEIPLAVVLFEEVAFRGVLPELIGPYWAAALFGLWHVRPASAVVFTAVAGLVLTWGAEAGGSLLVPIVWHWAANGLGVLVFQRKR
ncbi:CPBP family intramembrane glutamic endopeptidase [Actinoplanes sp. NPDC048796]|uniref:CPBP family intramembrane glutamic endopeptidase n=1 Tax=unclassified Actinoplanes TaxID=2626549 RepID=UPI0033ECC618